MNYGAGTTLNNRYRLDKKIGEGGFATVFQGTDLLLGRTVAVKILNTNLAADQELMGRFQLEARAVAALDHPNILTVHDFGLLSNSAFLVMPYVPNGAFSALMRTRRLSLEEVSEYLEQVSSALDSAHKMGIVHRDVKPQNILVRSNGRLVLTDFGFAKMLADVNAEAPTKALGTVHYVAPEQVRGMVSAYSDQYSLGVLLYQMVSGGLPFTGQPAEMIAGHMQKQPPLLAGQSSMAGVHTHLIENVDRVLQKVLAKTPANRYASCNALYLAFREAIVLPSYLKNPTFSPDDAITEKDDRTELVDPQLVNNAYANPPNVSYQYQGGDNKPTVLYPPQTPQTHVAMPPVSRIAPTPPQPQPRTPVMVRPPRLNIRTEPDQHLALSFELNGDSLKLGRELDNQLQVPLSTVSRHHATLFRMGPIAPGMTYRIVDNNSRNQLIYRGQIVSEKVLEDGDTIEIGKKGYGDYVVFLTYIGPVFR